MRYREEESVRTWSEVRLCGGCSSGLTTIGAEMALFIASSMLSAEDTGISCMAAELGPSWYGSEQPWPEARLLTGNEFNAGPGQCHSAAPSHRDIAGYSDCWIGGGWSSPRGFFRHGTTRSTQKRSPEPLLVLPDGRIRQGPGELNLAKDPCPCRLASWRTYPAVLTLAARGLAGRQERQVAWRRRFSFFRFRLPGVD